MRHLATVQLIDAVYPIEGKDRIQSARILGWNVIVTKDFSPGDAVVYVETDSVLPERPEFEFLRPKNFRIKTMKMASVISQGIAFPMSILPDDRNYVVGQDVTELLGIKEYEPLIDDPVPSPSNKKKHGRLFNRLMHFKFFKRIYFKFFADKTGSQEFPVQLVSKTDETRIQTVPDLLKDRLHRYVFTEKVDGTSGTWIYRRKPYLFGFKSSFMVCSRNRYLPHDDGSVYWQAAKKFEIEKLLGELSERYNANLVCLQGECVGPKVQGNKYHLNEIKVYAFNLIIDGVRMPTVDAKTMLMAQNAKVDFVPIVGIGQLLPVITPTVDDMLALAHGKSKIADVNREGLVVRSTDGMISFKAVDPLYLIEHGE